MKNGFRKVFLQEVKLIFGSPKKLFLTLGFPILLFFFYGWLFRVGTPHDFKVALIDYDQSTLSRKLVRLIDATPEIAIHRILQNEQEARDALQRGDIHALILIPSSLEKNTLQGKQSEVICYTNGQYLLPAGNIDKAFNTVVKAFSAGIDIEKRKKKGQEPYAAIADVQAIQLDTHVLYNPYTNYGYYLITPFLPFTLEMIVIILSIYIIGTPLKYGFAKEWLEASGNNPWAALWGKFLPYTLLFFFVGWWMDFYLFRIVGTPLSVPLFNVFLITCVLVLVHQLLAVIFISISGNMRSALTFGAGFSAICFSFGAYTFPIEGLPSFIQDISNIFPYTHFIKYFINRAIKGIPIDYTLHNLYALGMYFILFLITYPLFVKKLKAGSYA